MNRSHLMGPVVLLVTFGSQPVIAQTYGPFLDADTTLPGSYNGMVGGAVAILLPMLIVTTQPTLVRSRHASRWRNSSGHGSRVIKTLLLTTVARFRRLITLLARQGFVILQHVLEVLHQVFV